MLVVAAALVAPSTAFGVGDANRPACAQGTESSPGFRLYLPDCRAYELVTPPFKAGALVVAVPGAIAQDGEAVVMGATGAFDGVGNLWYQPNRNTATAVYRMSRTASGWQSVALTPPATEFPLGTIEGVDAAHAKRAVWSLSKRDVDFREDIFVTEGEALQPFAPVGPGIGPELAEEEAPSVTEELSMVGASDDLSHTLYQLAASRLQTREGHNGHGDLWPGDTTAPEEPSLYEYDYQGEPLAEPTLVGVRNNGRLVHNTEAELISNCGTELGSGQNGSRYDAVSGDGSIVYFTANECAEGPPVTELYARVDGSTTVPISEPSASACEACNTSSALAGAQFEGASQDGARVFFSTTQSLLPGQEGTNLYEYDQNGPVAGAEHPDGKIALVSSGSSNPEVQGVVRVARDGTRVYFVAKGALTGANHEGNSPQPGADNLYMWEAKAENAPRLAFVATLLAPGEEAALETQEAEEATTVAERSEAAALKAFEAALAEGKTFAEGLRIFAAEQEEVSAELTGALGPQGTLALDRSVWRKVDERPAQATPDGGVLLFQASAQLTAGDESDVPQVFAYDAEAETVSRVSVSTAPGFDQNGNVSIFKRAPRIPVAEYRESGSSATAESMGRAITEDGSRIFFTSADQLSPVAKRGATDIYEYREGHVYLISDGNDSSLTSRAPTVRLLGVSPSGRDVFFNTADQLVPQAADSAEDIYDARIEGGFPAPEEPHGCIAEQCRGGVGSAPAQPVDGSSSTVAGDNAVGVVITPPHVSRAQQLAKALRRCRKLHRRVGPRRRCERSARRAFNAASSTHHVSTATGRGSRPAEGR